MIIAFAILIILDAIGDALKNKPVKHLIEALHIGGWLMLLCFAPPMNIFVTIAGYVLLRYFLFDAVWNVTSGKRIDYIGDTSLYDRILSKVHPSLIVFTKLLAGAISIYLLL